MENSEQQSQAHWFVPLNHSPTQRYLQELFGPSDEHAGYSTDQVGKALKELVAFRNRSIENQETDAARFVELKRSQALSKKALVAVLQLKVTAADQDIPMDTLQMILKNSDRRFASLEDFELQPVVPYKLAEKWTGVHAQPSRAALTMMELLAMVEGAESPQRLSEDDDLALLIWLDHTLLDDILRRSKTDGWVLLAYRLLLDKALKFKGVARCLAYVQLAGLVAQYKPRDDTIWSSIIDSLITKHDGLNIDLLGQACLAHLVLSTNHSRRHLSSISDKLIDPIENDHIDAGTAIQDITQHICQEYHNATYDTIRGLSILVISQGMKRLIFFKRDGGWKCSVQGFSFVASEGMTHVSWGTGDDERVNIPWNSRSPFSMYIQRDHYREIMRAEQVRREMWDVLAQVKEMIS